MKLFRGSPFLDHSQRAFTRVDLFFVIGLLMLFAGMLVPSLAATKQRGQDMLCESNLKQLIRAWQLYTLDNRDRIVMNFHGGDAQGGSVVNSPSGAPWTVGWLDWTTSPDNTNKIFLTQERYSRLARYLGHASEVFRCPSDRYLSPGQRRRGWSERARSVAANLGVGDGNAESGPWDPIYKHIRKTSEFIYPAPGETYVYVDEHPDSINDPGLFNPRQNAWVDQPATYHNGAATFAFADGHTELHKWQSSLRSDRARRVKFSNTLDARAVPGDADIHWVSYRAGRVSERSY